METILLANLLSFISLNPSSVWVIISASTLLTLVFLVVLTTLLIKLLNNSATLISLGSRVKKEEDFDKQIRCAVDVTQSLRSMKHDNFADRVSVIQTHNGDHSITGIDFFKYSITHQSQNEDIYATINDFDKGKPIGVVLDIIDSLKLKKQPWLAYEDVEELKQSSYSRSFYQSYCKVYGTKSVYIFPLVDVRGYMFGFGMVEYVNKSYSMEPKRLEQMADRFKQIGALLSGIEKEK